MKNLHFERAKASRLNDHKRPHISNIGSLMIVQARSFRVGQNINFSSYSAIPQLNRLKRPLINTWPYRAELLFPEGLFGFTQYTHYLLIGHKQEMPLLRLQAIQYPSLSFFVIDPFLVYPQYMPVLTRADLKQVGVVNEAKLILLAIVDVDENPSTMNLAAPLLIHWIKRRGKQILFPNDPAFPIDI